jgi:hypothetical protein
MTTIDEHKKKIKEHLEQIEDPNELEFDKDGCAISPFGIPTVLKKPFERSILGIPVSIDKLHFNQYPQNVQMSLIIDNPHYSLTFFSQINLNVPFPNELVLG